MLAPSSPLFSCKPPDDTQQTSLTSPLILQLPSVPNPFLNFLRSAVSFFFRPDLVFLFTLLHGHALDDGAFPKNLLSREFFRRFSLCHKSPRILLVCSPMSIHPTFFFFTLFFSFSRHDISVRSLFFPDMKNRPVPP